MITGSAAVHAPLAPVPPVLCDDAPWGNILVHQPDAAEALGLQRILRSAGYRVIGPAATEGDLGRLAQQNQVDCALIDGRAPRASGVMLEERGIPFVVVAGEVKTVVAWRGGNWPIILKPYRATEILRAIHAAMRDRRRGDRPPASDARGTVTSASTA